MCTKFVAYMSHKAFILYYLCKIELNKNLICNNDKVT